MPVTDDLPDVGEDGTDGAPGAGGDGRQGGPGGPGGPGGKGGTTGGTGGHGGKGGSSVTGGRLAADIRDAVAMAVVVVLVVLCSIMFVMLGRLAQGQRVVRSELVKNRAAACAVLVSRSGTKGLPDLCTAPDVLVLYNPADVTVDDSRSIDESVRRTLCRTELFKDDVSCR